MLTRKSIMLIFYFKLKDFMQLSMYTKQLFWLVTFILLFSRHRQDQFRRIFQRFKPTYRNLLKLARLLSRSVVQLYHYWFPHFRCYVIIWNTQMVKNWFVMFYNNNILYDVNLSPNQALLKINNNDLKGEKSRKLLFK